MNLKHIGILLNMREMVEIPARCGALHRDAVELYESLRWYLSFINKNSGQVASRLVTDSYVPGIKLGLHHTNNFFIFLAINIGVMFTSRNHQPLLLTLAFHCNNILLLRQFFLPKITRN